MKKVHAMRNNEQRWEAEGIEDADYVFVAYGLPGRVVRGMVRNMRRRGEKVGIFVLLLPAYPEAAFKQVNPEVKGFISVENNGEGQMVEDVALTAKRLKLNVPIYVLPYVCGVPKMLSLKKITWKSRQENERRYINMVKKIPEITSNYAMFCGGCGHGVLLRLIGEVLTELGQDKNVMAAIGVGCSCHLKTGIKQIWCSLLTGVPQRWQLD